MPEQAARLARPVNGALTTGFLDYWDPRSFWFADLRLLPDLYY